MVSYVYICRALPTTWNIVFNLLFNRFYTSYCTTTISYYQTRPVRSLLTSSRNTHTYRRSIPTHQSRNTLNTLKDECLYVRKGPYPKYIRKRTTTTNYRRRTRQGGKDRPARLVLRRTRQVRELANTDLLVPYIYGRQDPTN